MGYYSAGDNLYGRGDYYRGDYYRGDPGLFGFLKKVGAAVGGGAIGFATGGVGGAIAGVRGALSSPSPVQGTALAPMPSLPTITPALPPPSSRPLAGFHANLGPISGGLSIGGEDVQQPVGTMTPQGLVPGVQLKGCRPNKSTYYKKASDGTGIRIPKGSVCVKRRHMNPANGRALRKALTRAHAFEKIAMKTIRILHPGKRKKFGGFKRRAKR